ncbi:unnamed protein product [Arabidopsis lyrata]|nr:unnamed protein product [Arabidopsis lyrata]
MALQEQLNKFNKQQEKCQSTLSSIIASSRTGPSRSSVPAATTSQKPNAVRGNLSLIFCLRQGKPSYTAEQINEACYVDMTANKAVFNSLRKNPKVHYDGRSRFSYKATHDIKDKKQLLSFVNKSSNVIDVVDLKDAYPNVMEDLQALKASGDIFWLPSNTGSKEGIVYPNDLKYPKIDDELKALFRDIDIPSDMLDVEKELLKIGLKPATNIAERKAAEQLHGVSNKPKDKKKKKKQEISKRTKLTNSHIPELFQSLNASSSGN